MRSKSPSENCILFINAKVWQADGIFNEAFGIKNGSFDFIGTNKQAGTLKNNYSNIIDLKGRLVLPGLIDGHLHLVNGAISMSAFDCSNIKSIRELKNEAASYVKEKNPQWITGGNLDINKLFGDTSGSSINIADEIYSEIPLFINNYDYHSAVCNTKALELSGLSGSSEKLKPGEVEIGKNGIPTGLIRESALNRVYEVIPELSLTDNVKAVTECIKGMHKCGITSVSDITLPHELDIYNVLYNSGKLNLRVNSYLPFTEFDNIKLHTETIKNIDKDFFSIKGFKAFWDGALGSDTALFSRNYKGKEHNGYVTELVQSGRIFELAKKIDKAGYQIIIHAIGDKAVSDVLDLYESLPNTKHLRHRIEHAQHIDPKDYERFAKSGVVASVQPVHLKYDAHTVFEKLPAKLIPNTHNYMQITKTGGVLNFGTDFPIVPFDPFENIRLAATRETDHGEFTPEHRIPMNECIKAYTLNNAYSNHNENAVGTISKGKAADFIILNSDIFENGIMESTDSIVLDTYINGEPVL